MTVRTTTPSTGVVRSWTSRAVISLAVCPAPGGLSSTTLHFRKSGPGGGRTAARRLDDHPRAPEPPHLADHGKERPPLLGQLVLDAGRRLGVAAAHQHTLALEHVEPLGEGSRADPWARVLELHEAARPFRKVVKDQGRPLGADDLRRGGDGAVAVVHVVHRALHRTAVY